MAEIQVYEGDLQVFETFRHGTLPDGRPYVIAADVCKAIGIKDASMAIRNIEEGEKGTIIIGTLGGPQKMLYLTKRGVGQLLGESHKRGAKDLRRTLFNAVFSGEVVTRSEIVVESKTEVVGPPTSGKIGHILVAQAHALQQMAQAYLDHENRIDAVESKQDVIAGDVLEVKKDVVAIAGKVDDASEAIDALLGATKDDSGYFFAIPYLEKMRVRIPPNMRGVIGGECRKVATRLGYNPYSFPTGPHGGFDGVRKFPKEVMNAWYAEHRGNPARAAWFPLQVHG